MRITRPEGLRALVVSACCCLALAACQDDVTGPSARVQPAGGRTWVALSPPQALPDDRTWLPFLGERKGEGTPAAQRVQALREEAKRLRRDGDLAGALETEERAAETAAGALARVPDAGTMGRALDALDAWVAEAKGMPEAGGGTDLAAGVETVRAARAGAADALSRGDTLEAVGHVARAATAARGLAPAAVALRVFSQAEEVVRTHDREMPEAVAARVDRLLRWSRDAVLTGDPERAFRRALYALQLVERYVGRRAGG